ncbi:trace amine-associated receptor 13c-like [Spinachia spinachia]
MMDGMEGAQLCFPQLLNSSCTGLLRPCTDTALLYTLLSSICVLTVFLNLLVIISISHFGQLHTPTNLLLLSLAISDLLVGLLVMPVEMVRFVETCWLLGDLYRIQMTRGRVELCVCACWAASFLYNGLVLKGHFGQPERRHSCYGECKVVISYVSGAVDLVLTFWGPCSVIVVLYVRVFEVAVSQARVGRAHFTAVGALKVTAKKSERKAARTLGLVILVFLMSFCPYYYPSLAGQDTSNSASSWVIVSWLLFFNSCLNPLIYAYFYPWFRKAIKLIVTLKILEQNSSQENII